MNVVWFICLSFFVIGIEYTFVYFTNVIYKDDILNVMAKTIAVLLTIIGVCLWAYLFFPA